LTTGFSKKRKALKSAVSVFVASYNRQIGAAR